MVFSDFDWQHFLSPDDSKRTFGTTRKLSLHEVSRWVLVGGLAVEFHYLSSCLSHQIRHLSDIDFIAPAYECIPETPPGKTMMQLIDAETSLRIDVFRADRGIMARFSTDLC